MLEFDESQTATDEVSCTLTLVARSERGGRIACRVPYPVLLRLCARSGIRRRSAIDAYRVFTPVIHATLDARWARGAVEPDGSLLLLLDDIEEPSLAHRVGTAYPRGATGFPIDLAKARGPLDWLHRLSLLRSSH